MSFSKHLSSRFLSLIWLVRGRDQTLSENIQHFSHRFSTECAAEISGWGKKPSTITVIKKKNFKWFVFNLIGLKFSNIFNCTHAKMIDHQPCWYFFLILTWSCSCLDAKLYGLENNEADSSQHHAIPVLNLISQNVPGSSKESARLHLNTQ